MSDISSHNDEVEPKVRGRPVAPIDEELIERFLSVGTPLDRIADYFNVSEKTLWNRFGNRIHQHRVLYEFSILEKQHEMALAGDSKILIHLGRTMLKHRQTEQAPLSVEDADRQGVEFTVIHPQRPSVPLSDEEQE